MKRRAGSLGFILLSVQLRQFYLKRILGDKAANFPRVDHVHFFGYYIGNYPGLDERKIQRLCALLNGLPAA